MSIQNWCGTLYGSWDDFVWCKIFHYGVWLYSRHRWQINKWKHAALFVQHWFQWRHCGPRQCVLCVDKRVTCKMNVPTVGSCRSFNENTFVDLVSTNQTCVCYRPYIFQFCVQMIVRYVIEQSVNGLSWNNLYSATWTFNHVVKWVQKIQIRFPNMMMICTCVGVLVCRRFHANEPGFWYVRLSRIGWWLTWVTHGCVGICLFLFYHSITCADWCLLGACCLWTSIHRVCCNTNPHHWRVRILASMVAAVVACRASRTRHRCL